MILTIFRSRLRKGVEEEYYNLAPKIELEAESMPGFISRKAYVSDDGERLSLVAFENEESQREWAKNSVHVRAMNKGRESFYSEYFVQVCEVVRESQFTYGEAS